MAFRWLSLLVFGLIFATLNMTSFAVAQDKFPEIYDSEQDKTAKPLPPAETAAGLAMPPGFKANVCVSEPDVQNPISMCWDSKGRLWIAESYTYAERAIRFELKLRDRILIFEDVNHDGVFDKRTVFTDDLQMLTSVAVGRGGVFVMCPSRLMFIPDLNQDDKPDGSPQVLLDGFDVAQESYHNFANGLKFGPDGWLYGRTGPSCPGMIGTPGTPTAERQLLSGAFWRYHTEKNTFEIICSGTTNPWGHDWDEHFQAFFINTVNGHLWHAIPGAHFLRSSTIEPNSHIYEPLNHHADHFHFDTGKSWMASRDGAANSLGGGHAHQGMMIYLGNNWPDEYRGHLFTFNFHGRRANQEILEREGSGFVAHHAPDMMVSNDLFFRPLDLSYGPDGSVYVIDWSDTGECHEHTGVHRTSGRIYRVVYEPNKLNPNDNLNGNLARFDCLQLIQLQARKNAWWGRMAMRLLYEKRLAQASDFASAKSWLQQIIKMSDDSLKRAFASSLFGENLQIPASVLRLRLLLTLKQMEGTTPELLAELLQNPDEHLRIWAIRCLSDAWPIDGILGPLATTKTQWEHIKTEYAQFKPQLLKLAKSDPSGLVKLELASLLQRLPLSERSALAAELVTDKTYADDHNLPLITWYGISAVGAEDPTALLTVLQACQWSKTRALISRRIGEETESHPALINDMLVYADQTHDAAIQYDILFGLSESLKGLRKATKPAAWETTQAHLMESKDVRITKFTRELSVLFGDGRALDEIRAIALDDTAEIGVRRAALETLITNKPDDLKQTCEKLLKDFRINVVAAKGLSLYDDPAVGQLIVDHYKSFRAPARPEIISLLVTRKSFTQPLLKAIEQKKISVNDLTAYHVRQIHGMKDKELTAYVTRVWGELRESPAEKAKLITELKTKLTPDVIDKADKSQGRFLFQQTCSKCHRLYGSGESIGPDLTGSNRNNMDYLLENIIDPSAVINKDFRMTNIVLTDGRFMNGLVTERNPKTLTLQTLTDKITIALDDILEQAETNLSPMPEGLMDKMTPEQIRDLFSYLMTASQVPLPADKPAP
jgi:putative membrane-bound dehydrogenase-like protein